MGAPAPSALPPFRRRDRDRSLVSYAQVGEDVRLARVLWDEPAGFYVDVGASDPVVDSVTKLFYDRGWSGINVEPGPAAERLGIERPRDVTLAVAVGATEELRDFWVTQPDSGLSSFERPDPHALPPGSRVSHRQVVSRRLDAILEEHGRDRPIDFLKIDVEGAEPEVIGSVDLRRFRPRVLVVEAIAPLTFEPTHGRWEPHVLGSGYVLAAFDGINRFYVPDDEIALVDVLAYPLTLLDRFVPSNGPPPDRPAADGREFPTLADRIALGEIPEAPATALTIVLEDLSRADGRDIAQRAIVGSERDLQLANGVCQLAGDSLRPVATLPALGRHVRDARAHVLLVSNPAAVTPAALDALRHALASDDACATVSLAETHSASPAGLPPGGVDAPCRGVVLARREMVQLVLGEADDRGEQSRDAIAGDIVETVLSMLERPGLVHRAVAAKGVDDGRRRRKTRFPQPPEIVLDGRTFSMPVSGTQVQTLGLLGGLARAGADVAVLTPPELHPTMVPALERLPDSVRLLERVEVGAPTVFHRPFQLASFTDLADCLSVGERLVLTHQDMIMDRTPAYAGGVAPWRRYRLVTDAAFGSADEVGFFSLHAARDAASEGALDPERATVVHLGVDHLRDRLVDDAPADPLRGRPYLLVVGNSYWHKNRLFALRLVRWLVEQRRWDGGLALVGGHPPVGSSKEAEDAFLDANPSLRARVIDLGHVPERFQSALYRDAELVVFPSLYEGFGLIPFEAAALGTACVYAHWTSMSELLPGEGGLPSLDLEEAGPFVFTQLTDTASRDRIVAAITARASSLTWDRTAAGYLEVYRRAIERAPRVNRGLLRSAPDSTQLDLSPQEAWLMDVYRRRRSFRIGADLVLRGGAGVLQEGRRAASRVARRS